MQLSYLAGGEKATLVHAHYISCGWNQLKKTKKPDEIIKYNLIRFNDPQTTIYFLPKLGHSSRFAFLQIIYFNLGRNFTKPPLQNKPLF